MFAILFKEAVYTLSDASPNAVIDLLPRASGNNIYLLRACCYLTDLASILCITVSAHTREWFRRLVTDCSRNILEPFGFAIVGDLLRLLNFNVEFGVEYVGSFGM